MLLKEIFDQLTFGELSQISIGGSELGAINESNYVRMIPHINMALAAIYKRFPLKEGRGTFTLQAGAYIYSLVEDDVSRIETVKNELGNELSLNEPSDYYSCYTTSPKVIKVCPDIVNQLIDVPDYYKSTSLEVIYRASHPLLVDSILFDPETIEIELPYTHLEPVIYFIASRVLSPTGAGPLQGVVGNNYMQRYEMACQQLILQNPQIENTSYHTRLTNNGWA